MKWILALLLCVPVFGQDFASVAVVGNLFHPEEIPGLKCNLDAYQFRTLTNGASVGTWLCEKTGITVTNSTASQQPKYQITNGFGYLRFDGVDDYLYQSVGNEYPTGDTNRIMSLVTVSISGTNAIGKGLDGSGQGWSIALVNFTAAYAAYGVIRSGGDTLLTISMRQQYADFISVLTSGQTSYSLFTNGITCSNLTTPSIPFRSSTVGLTIGRCAGAYGVALVPQIIIYSNTLSYIDRKHIEEYISNRYKTPNVIRQ